MTRDPIKIKVEDKRHWAKQGEDPSEAEGPDEAADLPAPVDAAELEAMRSRAEAAERKLREVQEGFLAAQAELDRTRERLERDLERKVSIRFGDLANDLLETSDDLDRAIEAGATVEGAAPVVAGVALARDRFLAALGRAGLTRIDPSGRPFDPNVAEAVGVAPVSDAAAVGTVVQVLSAGFALGDRVIRPARVLVGRMLD